jgi:hypothetical protein
VALAILVVGALVVALLYRQAELVPTDPSVVSSLPPTPARAAAASPAATSSVPLRPTTEEAATTPTTPPQPSDTPSPAQPDTAVPSAKATQLFIDFEHPLKSGTVRIWLDRDQVLEEDLESRVSKSVVGLKFRKGGIEKLLDVAPGRHEVRAKVTWDDNEKAATIVGTFKSGSTRYLEVRIGRLRKNLSLEWK